MVVDRINYLFKFYVDGNLVGTQDISASFGDVDLGIPISKSISDFLSFREN